jgi:hypothetical protein
VLWHVWYTSSKIKGIKTDAGSAPDSEEMTKPVTKTDMATKEFKIILRYISFFLTNDHLHIRRNLILEL